MKNTLLIIAGILILPSILKGASGAASGAMLTLSYANDTNAPAAMRRNNPGNIVAGAGYQGEIPGNSRFATFKSYAYGIRAMILLLKKYITQGSSYTNPCVQRPQNTIVLIIEQWAPRIVCGGDNSNQAVDNYISVVESRTRINRNSKLNPNKQTIRALAKAMAEVEVGKINVITDEQFDAAWSIA